MPNQKGFSKVAIIIIVLILIGGAYFVFSKKDRKISIQDIENKDSQSNQSFGKDLSKNSAINPKDYSLVEYPLKQSPIYSQLGEYCSDPEASETIQQDARLIKNGNKVIIPSIRQIIFEIEKRKADCLTEVSIFSQPANGKYLYLKVYIRRFGENLDFVVYALDLSNFSFKTISYPDSGFFEITEDNYQILLDEKSVVTWNRNSVYLINLETNSSSVLYTAPQNHWLTSSIVDDEVHPEDTYDIEVGEKQIIVGVYDRTKTKDGKLLELTNSSEEIKLMFIKQTTIPIPN
ncbi:MAG: hypothetical protein HW401_404 [Parcubacteria group bacterium]|nr:hypothetical protein [Parcubacteria group bacterium]